MLALVVTVPASEAELAADTLWSLGVLAIEERRTDGVAEAGTEDHLVELWTSLGDDLKTVTSAAEAFPARWRWHTVDIDPAVAETWRAHVTASWISPDLVIVPAWIDPGPIASDITTVRIDPAAAFGLGDHPTTVLSLRALRATMFPGATVLDVGCGSGVIAVTAALLGAPYVEAVDISPAAVEAASRNAAANDVTGPINISTTSVTELREPYDIVVANILSPVIVDLAPDLMRLTADDGVLIVSGLLTDRLEAAERALSEMHRVDHLHRDGWSALVMRH